MAIMDEIVDELKSQLQNYHECSNMPLVPGKRELNDALRDIDNMTVSQAKKLLKSLVNCCYHHRNDGERLDHE